MKKIKIIMGALALAVLAVIIIACTKEKEKEKKAARNSSEMVTVSKEDDMSAYLKQFKEKMQSASKGDETLSLEDARWHLEAVLNYTYGDAGHEISDIQCDTFYYELHTGGDEVTLAQLNEAFNALSSDVEKAYDNCDFPEKSILVIQTSFDNSSKDGDDVIIRILTEISGVTFPISVMLFDSTDYWYEDDCSGKCGEYVGTYFETGAVQQLQYRINLNLPNHSCGSGSVYFTDIEYVEFEDYMVQNMPDPNSPHGYRIPYISCLSNEAPICFSPEEMNYYLVQGIQIAYEFAPQRKSIINMTNEYYLAVPINYHLAYHHYKYFYGVLYCNSSVYY